jgi:hypothetical protein
MLIRIREALPPFNRYIHPRANIPSVIPHLGTSDVVAERLLAYKDNSMERGYQLLNISDTNGEERRFIGYNMWYDGNKWVLPGNASEIEVSFDNVLLSNIHLTRKYELNQKDVEAITCALTDHDIVNPNVRIFTSNPCHAYKRIQISKFCRINLR